MKLEFYRDFFATQAEVLDDVKQNGTWPTTYVSGPSDGMHVHWHTDEVHAYIMEGETDFLDAASGERTQVSTGDKIVVPAGALHAEGPVADRVVYLIALPGPRAPDEFLVPRDPDDPARPSSD